MKAILEFLDILGIAIGKHSKSAIAKNAALLSSIFLKTFDLRRRMYAAGKGGELVDRQVAKVEDVVNEKALQMVYKLNDAAFRPVFVQMVEWAASGLPKKDQAGRVRRQLSVFGFLQFFFGQLKSIVTSYVSYVIDDAVHALRTVDINVMEERALWSRVLKTLATCFEHDQDDFWQAPSHFGAVAPVLLEQFLLARSSEVTEDLVETVVELATAADSQAHQKELNAGLMKHLKSEQTEVRLAAVKCEQALTDRLGEEWLSMLHEMLPRISELQEDDDEVVERETHRWIVKIEGVLGESLDSMLQ